MTDSVLSQKKVRRESPRSRHTPGPWHQLPTNNLCIESPSGNVALCNLARMSDADARLIAAAPDLLRILQLLIAPFDGAKAVGMSLGQSTISHDSEMLAMMRAAVYKAEGRL